MVGKSGVPDLKDKRCPYNIKGASKHGTKTTSRRDPGVYKPDPRGWRGESTLECYEESMNHIQGYLRT